MGAMDTKNQKPAQQVCISIQMAALVQLTNSPTSMADEVRKYSKILGDTGQGLTSKESIWEGTELA